MTRTVSVEIEGFRSLLEHRMVQSKEVTDLTRKVQKDSNDWDSHEKLAEISCYRDEEGKLCIPSEYLETSFTKAGVSEKMLGSGKKTYKDTMKGQVFIDPDMIPLSTQEYNLSQKFVKVGQARILRVRPEIPKGWKAKFNMTIFDDSLPLGTIKNVVEYAGKFVGVGDWRPKYGLFKVNSFEEIEEN